MICPNCFEDYEFVEFEVDPETLEHRGVFKCQCADDLLFSEATTRDMVADDDFEERLRISRLLHISESLKEIRPSAARTTEDALSVNMKHLERYIELFAEKSIQQLKGRIKVEG